MKRGLLIDTNGKMSLCRINDYEDLQDLVDGWIEAVSIDFKGHTITCYLNEEGKLRDLPINSIATRLWNNR